MNRSPTQEVLYQLYITEDRQAKEIAEQLGISKTQVYRCLRAYGIERNKVHNANAPTEEALRRLYVEQNLTAEEIAKGYNCTPGNIFFYLRRYGIERDKIARNSRVPSRERLHQLYVTENRRVEEVAEIIGYSRSRTFYLLETYGIERNKRATTVDVEPPELTLPPSRPHPGPVTKSVSNGRRGPHRYSIDKEWLQARYLDDNINTPQIAEELGVHVSIVLNALHRYDIPIKPFHVAFRDKPKRFGDFSAGQRRLIQKRDHSCCQMCSTKEGDLECHHIIPSRFGGQNSVDNGILLCNLCHDKVGFHELNWVEELLVLRGTKTG